MIDSFSKMQVFVEYVDTFLMLLISVICYYRGLQSFFTVELNGGTVCHCGEHTKTTALFPLALQVEAILYKDSHKTLSYESDYE